jgi:ABC-2 type transport system permease protein
MSLATAPTAPRHLGTFVAFLGRDLIVLARNSGEFIGQIAMQPLLLVFVFTYLLPKSGLNLGGPGFSFATVLLPGLLASTAFTTGIAVVAAPLAIDLGSSREIEDRALAPLPLWAVALEKILFGAWQALLSGLLVFPLAYFIPATAVQIHVHHWPLFILMIALTSLLSAAAGLTLGCLVNPQRIGILYGLIVIPITFLGCVYYPWAQLAPVRWAQVAVLLNPLVYVTEGMRAALTPTVKHMPTAAYLGVSSALLVVFLVAGTRLLTRRLQQ